MQQKIKTHLKITLLYTGLTATAFLLLSLLVYYFAERLSAEDFYKRLDIRAVLVGQQHFPLNEQESSIIKDLRNDYLERLPHEREYIQEIADSQSSFSIPGLQLPQNFYRQVFRSEEHTSELQSRENIVCRLLLEKKN